jgi:hypothetical protein
MSWKMECFNIKAVSNLAIHFAHYILRSLTSFALSRCYRRKEDEGKMCFSNTIIYSNIIMQIMKICVMKW